MGPVLFHGIFAARQASPIRRRARSCLLKGCEQWFTPSRPQSRYCSPACVEAARRWRRAQASRRYRASGGGRERRAEQHRRYRQRQRERAAAAKSAASEGQRAASAQGDVEVRWCARPGCYVTFVVRHARSCRRFCSVVCRLALRRVLDREERYRQRRRRWRRERLRRRYRGPDTS